ncbi:hypothetical protein [uncultured Litoreibacter sp.]|uniref:hypothetical protein n=1 Tax=uncultured Litoreibacter sp. TaxID=1392394 RepID=UPI002637A00E|nr:hypothetical protein [uncultured Litoreibacter sp.]
MMRYLVPAFALCLHTTPLLADQVINDDLIVTRDICVGSSTCMDGEPFNGEDIKIRSTNPEILFFDTSTTAGNMWRIRGDSDVGLFDSFAIRNDATGFTPFIMSEDAPGSAFVMAPDGDIGLGTVLPETTLHIVDTGSPGIRIEATNGVAPDWLMNVGSSGLAIFDMNAGPAVPFTIANGAPSNSLRIRDNGNVAMGVSSASVPLHVSRADGTASVLVENRAGSPSAVREMFRMANNGGSFFTLDNTQSGTEWFFVHENAAPNRFIITDGIPDGPEMTLTAEGVLTVEGGFVAGSTTLNVPDYVFGEDYALRPLAEVASFVRKNSHLPDVPSAAEIARDGLNMTDMQMTLLKKVEELTLYTIALEEEAHIQAENYANQTRLIAELSARLDRLE